MFVGLPGSFDSQHNPRYTRWWRANGLNGLTSFQDTVRTKARQTSTVASIILASPHDDRRNYTPYRTTNVVHSRLRSHPHRWPLQGHQLGEDNRFLGRTTVNTAAKMLTIAGIARILTVVLAPPRANPSRCRHQVVHKLSSYRGTDGWLLPFAVMLRCE